MHLQLETGCRIMELTFCERSDPLTDISSGVRAGSEEYSSVEPSRDPRWANILGGFSPDGQPTPMSFKALHDLTLEWEEASPAYSADHGVGALLRTARSLFAHSWFDYEFMAVACLVGFQAVEAAFRYLYPGEERTPYRQLVERAETEAILPHDIAEVAKAGVELRNFLSHPLAQSGFTVGMAAGMLETQHRLSSILTAADLNRRPSIGMET